MKSLNMITLPNNLASKNMQCRIQGGILKFQGLTSQMVPSVHSPSEVVGSQYVERELQ
jgi:hypothetical protein